MDRLFDLNLFFSHRKSGCFILSFAWICGLLLGTAFSASASAELSPTLLATVHSSMSFLWLLTVRLLPFLLSALSIYFSQPILLYAVAFAKAFLYSYIGTGLLMAYCSAGWVVFSFLTFSDALILPVLWFSWLRFITVHSRVTYGRHVIGALLAVAVSCVDYTYVAPYLARLISF